MWVPCRASHPESQIHFGHLSQEDSQSRTAEASDVSIDASFEAIGNLEVVPGSKLPRDGEGPVPQFE